MAQPPPYDPKNTGPTYNYQVDVNIQPPNAGMDDLQARLDSLKKHE